MKSRLHRLTLLGLLAGILGLTIFLGRQPARAAAESGAKAGDKTEALLRAAKLDFKRPKDNLFRVLIEVKGEITAVIVEEKKATWKATNGSDVLFAYMYCEVLPLPKDFKPPTGMLLRLAELNNGFKFGNVGLSKQREGGYSVFFNLSCFLRGCDAEQLTDFLYVAHYTRLALRKELSRYLEDR
jgi:hypothetical protein